MSARWTPEEDAACDAGIAAGESVAVIQRTRLPHRNVRSVGDRLKRRKIKRRAWSPEKIERFRKRWASGEPTRILAQEFGLSVTSVSAVSAWAKRLGLEPRRRGAHPPSEAELAIKRALRRANEPLTWPRLRVMLPPRLAANPRTRRTLLYLAERGDILSAGAYRVRTFTLAAQPRRAVDK